MRSHLLAGAVTGVLSLTLVAGCGSSGDDSTSAAKAPAGDANAPAKMTMWAWAPNIDKVVAIWNKAHPTQPVTVSKQAQGDALVTKLLTANKAGNPPDLFQAEYQALPVLVTNGVAADITSAANKVRNAFPAGTWKLTSFGEKTYGIPQDSGPMMLYYRADLFKKFGLPVPKTWDEFATVAKTLRTKDPKRYLTTFSSADPGWFAGLAEQAGANWWTNSGGKWTVAINDTATKKVADYWGGLVSSGVVQGQPMYTPQWNKAMSDGTLLAWPSAVWGAGVLTGVAPSTQGKWQMAPMPQWSAGQSVSGFWGGSSTAVSSKSKNRAAAEKFATWLNSSKEALDALVSISAIYPAATAGQSAPGLAKAPSFMPNQPTFYKTAAQISIGARGFTWGPNVNLTYSTYNDAFAKAIQKKAPFSAALDTMQSASVADLKKQGFTVAAGG